MGCLSTKQVVLDDEYPSYTIGIFGSHDSSKTALRKTILHTLSSNPPDHYRELDFAIDFIHSKLNHLRSVMRMYNYQLPYFNPLEEKDLDHIFNEEFHKQCENIGIHFCRRTFNVWLDVCKKVHCQHSDLSVKEIALFTWNTIGNETVEFVATNRDHIK